MSDRGESKSQHNVESENSQNSDVRPSVFAEVWQSAKYSLVQETYNGVSQLGRGMGADIKERDLVQKPAAPTTATEKLAQDIGTGIGKVPVLVGMYAMTRLGMGRTAASMSLVPSAEASIARLSVAGALSSGIAIPSAGQNLWQERGTQAVTGALAMYTFGKMQSKLSQSAGLYESQLPATALSSLTHLAKRGTAGTISGAASGFVGAETQAILSELRPANIEELSRSINASAAMGGTLNILKTPGARPHQDVGRIVPQAIAPPPETTYALPTMHVPKFKTARTNPAKPEAGEGK
ncbi:MAG: hypothetical protein IPJ49_16135 [Candidatus Obscuribacter sp.]|nr:hypothetical protein [Candidatus Obscuribacter sp.]